MSRHHPTNLGSLSTSRLSRLTFSFSAMSYAPSTLSLEITTKTAIVPDAKLPNTSDYSSSNAACSTAMTNPAPPLLRVSEVPTPEQPAHAPVLALAEGPFSSPDAQEDTSMSRRRLASNRPFLQRNLSMPKRPFLQRNRSSAASPLPTSAVTLSFRDLFSKLTSGTPPMTPVDQIASVPQEPPTPGKVPAKRQNSTIKASRANPPLLTPATPLPRAMSGPFEDAQPKPRRLSYSTENAAHLSPDVDAAFTAGNRGLESPAII